MQCYGDGDRHQHLNQQLCCQQLLFCCRVWVGIFSVLSLQSNQLPRCKLGQHGSIFKLWMDPHITITGGTFMEACRACWCIAEKTCGLCMVNFATAGTCVQLMRSEPSLLHQIFPVDVQALFCKILYNNFYASQHCAP